MKKRAYFTTLSTEGYLPGVIALGKALNNVNANYPLYALLSEEISKETEKKLNIKGIKTIRRTKMDLPQEIIDRNKSKEKNRWNYTFDKLNVFELTDFEKIVFIDSDIYVRQNIDCLFEKPHMSAVIDKHYGPNLTCRCLELTSGVIVVEPRKGYIEKFKEIIKTIIDKRDAIGDQDILQEFDKDWKNKPELHLKNKYNIFFPYLEYYVNFQEYSMDDLAVIHFIYPKKPWMFDKENRVDEYVKYIDGFTKECYEEEKAPEYIDCLYGDRKHAKKIVEEYCKLIVD